MSISSNFFLTRRTQLKLTQRAIAIQLDMTTAAVSKWEQPGGSLPQPQLWDRLAEVYKVSPERIASEILKAARADRCRLAASA